MTTADRQHLLAEIAWRHLLNRHDLAHAVDQLDCAPDNDDQLRAAAEHAAHHWPHRPSVPRPTTPRTTR